MNKVVTVKIKDVYGAKLVYPVCSIAEGFARIAASKSLTPKVIREIRAMGFEMVVEAESAEAVLEAIAAKPERSLYAEMAALRRGVRSVAS